MEEDKFKYIMVDKQVSDALIGHSVVNDLLKGLNYPFNRFLGKRFGGDALRIVAKKKSLESI